MKVLIADDDVTFRTALSAMLRHWGYEVVLACDGSEAWVALQRENAPQIAILDWSMPAMEGIEVCRRLRNNDSIRYVYVLLLTAKASVEDLVLAMESGADDFVAKPFNPQELRARLRAGCRIVELQQKLLEVRIERVAVAGGERSALVRGADGVFVPSKGHPAGGSDVKGACVHSRRVTGSGVLGWSLTEEICAATAGDDELLAAVLSEFKADGAARLRRIENARAINDTAAIRTELHAIKVSARRVGAVSLAVSCDELETVLNAGCEPSTHDLQRLQTVFDGLFTFENPLIVEAGVTDVSTAALGRTA